MQRLFLSALSRYHRTPRFFLPRTISTGPIYEGSILLPGYSHRTVRIDNLPQDYDLNSVLNAIQANPVERILTRHDHVLVQFFSNEMAQRCVRDYQGLLSLTIHPHPNPPLSCFLVAALGYLSLSRVLEVDNIPLDITEDTFKDQVRCYSASVQRSESEARARARLEFLDIHDAIKAKATLVRLESFKDAKIIYKEHPASYMFPSWFTPSVDDAPDAKRKVVIDNIPDGAAVVECRRWTNAFDLITPTTLSCARFTRLKTLVVSFGTTESAQNFLQRYKPRAKTRGMSMSLAQDRSRYIDRCILTARDLGANRKVHIHIGQGHRRSDKDYIHMFHRYGGLSSVADRFQYVQFMMPAATEYMFICHAEMVLQKGHFGSSIKVYRAPCVQS
ncbi:uncharacterized protein BT62DRAFT_930472 [Guyanagaster necrorhizus]|uniref:Uncharacterized protein n=1 Tax=Guyanagaster necrorhizus TaxID=856835 RepID=A0A9P7VVH7_9AGAR|nr:uncharacterized protein BT62DRAFT_930472 [Guyanagaster necrorhizus MCA 3950]KAG7447460.1 hypothetical protein BT62DRAFT_930472 [Guyanagaster necrorhizus MCA 3950]